jgi:SWI/SNF-related matrix-associated actin-dependent regulator of chromatin subfamily A3
VVNEELNVDILPHQSQALRWMIERENPKLPTSATEDVQFWTRQIGQGGKAYWLNVATKTPQQATPVLGRGGIIADGMGLGKTLTTLSLVLATRKDAAEGHSNATLIGRYPATSLISVPAVCFEQLGKADPRACGSGQAVVFHVSRPNAQRNGDDSERLRRECSLIVLMQIVLTTYQTVAADMSGSAANDDKKAKKSIGPLGKVKWKRVVADEGHVLKNPKAKSASTLAWLTQ